MKKYQSSSKNTIHKKNREDDIIKKAVIKTLAAALCFAVITLICKMPFEPCRKIKNEVVYFLGYSYDFKAIATTAYDWFSEQINRPEVTPAINDSEEFTDDNNTVVSGNGD